jgi:hypothetical protein
VRRGLRVLLCIAAWALLIVSGLFLWAAVDYCLGVPELYGFFGAEALEEQTAKAYVWVAVQGLGFLIAAGVCFAVMRVVWKKGINTREKRKSHENTAFDTERY